MYGQRIQGRHAAAGPGRLGWLSCVLLAVPLAGCFPDEQADNATSAIETTAGQVERSGKGDRHRTLVWRAPISSERLKQDRLPWPPSRRSRPVLGSTAALAPFYAALGDLERGVRRRPVTVLHLGDSHIASDRFTGDLRELLQVRFGDSGRGLMMPGFPFAYYRARGVRFTKSAGWTVRSSLHKHAGPYGLTGVRLTARKADAWLRLASTEGAFEWAEVTLLTGPKQGTAVISVGDARKAVQTRADAQGAKRVRIDRKGSKLTVRPKGDGAVTVLSWAIGNNRPGVRYVNLGIPSATADITRRWDDALIADDLKALRPELIVFGYGTNEGFNDGLDVAAYRERVMAFLQRLQAHAPNASLLMIGPADSARFPRFARAGRKASTLKGASCRELDAEERRTYRILARARSKRLARWHPPPKLAAVREALREVAGRSNAMYWDWSKVMGGPCGVHDWVNAKPALAASDHVHITAAGSKRTAEALYLELMSGLEAHRRVASR